MENFVTVARSGEIKPGKTKLVFLRGVGITIYNAGGAFYATRDHCTGDGGSLAEGALSGSLIECPGDGARFYLPTGVNLYPRDLLALITYRVRVDRDEVKLNLAEVLMKNDASAPARIVQQQPAFAGQALPVEGNESLR